MPKDKEKLVVKTTKKGKKDDEKKKKEKEDEKNKRRHSLTDYSTTSSSSSSSSSSNSSTASDSSFSTNSSLDEFEKNKGTMTTPPRASAKSDSSDSEKKDIPGPSNPGPSKPNGKKKNQKERKLTKKEKKLANEQQNAGQQHNNSQLSAASKKVIEAAINHTPPPAIQFETFGNYEGDEAVGKMLVRGVNEAAKQALGGDEIQMPFYGVRQTEPTGTSSSSSTRPAQSPEQHDFDGDNHYHTYFDEQQQQPKLDLLDGHQLGQEKYLRTKKLRYYDGLNIREKVRERMGFGIAGTGLRDRVPQTLSLQNANHILRHTYSQLIERSFNMENWRQQFGAHLLQEGYHREPRHKELEKYMRSLVDRMVSEEPDQWKRTTMEAVLTGDLDLVVQRIAEMDRILIRKDIEVRRLGLDLQFERYEQKTHEQRFQHCVDIISTWMITKYLEKAPEVNGQPIHVVRGVSVLMYLASAGDREIMCMRNNHKKCTMMAFLLSSMSADVRRNLMLLSATNGLTALHFCAMTGWPCQMDILLKYGASTEIMTDNWQTPMCFAARRNCTLMARQLMWHGADLSVLQRFGYSVTVAMSGYISRKYIADRQEVLQDVYDSFLNAYLGECDERVELRMFKRHSALQTCRISQTVSDAIEIRTDCVTLIKTMQTCIRRDAPSDTRPIGLFLIPVSYTSFDSTMKAHYPHIVKVPLLQNAAKIAACYRMEDYTDDEESDEECEEDEGEEEEEEEEEEEREPPVVEQAKISKLFSKAPVLTVGQGDKAKNFDLLPFFNHEHNGNIYSYTMPPCFPQVNPGTPATLTLYINEEESRYFENTFFMWQIVEVSPNYTVKTIDEDDEIYERERLGIVREKLSGGFTRGPPIQQPKQKKDKKD